MTNEIKLYTLEQAKEIIEKQERRKRLRKRSRILELLPQKVLGALIAAVSTVMTVTLNGGFLMLVAFGIYAILSKEKWLEV